MIMTKDRKVIEDNRKTPPCTYIENEVENRRIHPIKKNIHAIPIIKVILKGSFRWAYISWGILICIFFSNWVTIILIFISSVFCKMKKYGRD
jgi:hypothetical protein